MSVRIEAGPAGRRARAQGVWRRQGRELIRPVARWARAMLDALDLPGAELSVVLCDDPFIHDLNRRFAAEDHATDVLAFAAHEAPGPRVAAVLGDVVISIETARRQAAARRAELDDEVRLLLAHGLLHLLGYDHRRAAERRIMFAKTRELVELTTTARRARPKRSA